MRCILKTFPVFFELFKRSIASGIPFHYELRLRRFDGEYRWFDYRGVPIRDKSGRIVPYILGTDIEDRKRAEEALRNFIFFFFFFSGPER